MRARRVHEVSFGGGHVEPHFEEPYDLWEKSLSESYRRRFKIIVPPDGHLGAGTRTPKSWREGDVAVVDKSQDFDGTPIFEQQVYVQSMRRMKETPHLARARHPHCDPEVYLELLGINGDL